MPQWRHFSHPNTMKIKLVLLMLTLAGCSGHKAVKPVPTPQTPVETGTGQRHTPLIGQYSASRVSGDFAGYPQLNEFILHMEAVHGIPRQSLYGLFSKAHRKQWTLDYMNRQGGPAQGKPRPGSWSKYRAQFLTELHIDSGTAFWRQHAQALSQAEERYGVPPEYILGIMGVETIYGRNMGKDRVLDALTTLAFDYPRRSAYFTEELENYLVMVSAENIDPMELRGSFAGAMGLGQFMPGSFLKWAVDHNIDGRRDLWDPDDAIGSIANYFSDHGWRRGEPVVTAAAVEGEVTLPTGYDKQYSLSELAAAGISPATEVPADEKFSLLLLRGHSSDEYWLGLHNFFVITRYNHSTHYAMAVHELAQAIKQRHSGGAAGAY
jgi:membrane-bound lytic murein transglycosylase B